MVSNIERSKHHSNSIKEIKGMYSALSLCLSWKSFVREALKDRLPILDNLKSLVEKEEGKSYISNKLAEAAINSIKKMGKRPSYHVNRFYNILYAAKRIGVYEKFVENVIGKFIDELGVKNSSWVVKKVLEEEFKKPIFQVSPVNIDEKVNINIDEKVNRIRNMIEGYDYETFKYLQEKYGAKATLDISKDLSPEVRRKYLYEMIKEKNLKRGFYVKYYFDTPSKIQREELGEEHKKEVESFHQDPSLNGQKVEEFSLNGKNIKTILNLSQIINAINEKLTNFISKIPKTVISVLVFLSGLMNISYAPLNINEKQQIEHEDNAEVLANHYSNDTLKRYYPLPFQIPRYNEVEFDAHQFLAKIEKKFREGTLKEHTAKGYVQPILTLYPDVRDSVFENLLEFNPYVDDDKWLKLILSVISEDTNLKRTFENYLEKKTKKEKKKSKKRKNKKSIWATALKELKEALILNPSSETLKFAAYWRLKPYSIGNAIAMALLGDVSWEAQPKFIEKDSLESGDLFVSGNHVFIYLKDGKALREDGKIERIEELKEIKIVDKDSTKLELKKTIETIFGRSIEPVIDERSKPVIGGIVTSGIWDRRDYGYHKAIDIAAPLGSHVYAPVDGVVVKAGKLNPLAGYGTILYGIDGYIYVFAHLQKNIPVKKGDYVYSGEIIGIVGLTGRTTGPHLHIQVIRLRGNPNIDEALKKKYRVGVLSILKLIKRSFTGSLT